jgi:GTP-dependent phosphoenolpyruvate carboxykinase
MDEGKIDKLLKVDLSEWHDEVLAHETYLTQTFGDRVPSALLAELQSLKSKIEHAASH